MEALLHTLKSWPEHEEKSGATNSGAPREQRHEDWGSYTFPQSTPKARSA